MCIRGRRSRKTVHLYISKKCGLWGRMYVLATFYCCAKIPRQLTKARSIYFGLWFQGHESLSCGEAQQRVPGSSNRKQSDHILTTAWNEAESMVEVERGRYPLQSCPLWHTSSNKTLPPKPPQTAPPPGEPSVQIPLLMGDISYLNHHIPLLQKLITTL